MTSSRVFWFFWNIYVLGLLTSSEGCGLDRQDYAFSEDWNGSYKLHYVPANWEQARLTCEQEGAVLATPYTLKDNAELHELVKSRKLDCGIYIGVKESQLSKGEYHTIEGIPLCRLPYQWADGEPNSIVDSCLVLQPDGKLGDEPCSEPLPFVCYKKHKPCNTCRNPCKTSDPGYKFDQRTGSCYKFHTTPTTWGEAEKRCSYEGGHLAIINSQIESLVLKELFAQYPPDALPGVTHHTVVHIGFHNLFLKNNWINVDGKNLTQAGFSTWSPGQPDNAGNNEPCGSIFRDGLLNDLPCGARDGFICEIDTIPA